MNRWTTEKNKQTNKPVMFFSPINIYADHHKSWNARLIKKFYAIIKTFKITGAVMNLSGAGSMCIFALLYKLRFTDTDLLKIVAFGVTESSNVNAMLLNAFI